MYKTARILSGLTIEQAAERLYIGARTLINYESGTSTPPPEVVMRMSKVYRIPWLTQHYCKEHCAIGKAYSYEILTNVNLDPASVMLKLITEMKEAQEVLHNMLEIAVNKNHRDDFSEQEMKMFKRYLHEFLDVEHNVETLKISLNKWLDISEVIQEHNQKCIFKGYVDKKRALSEENLKKLTF